MGRNKGGHRRGVGALKADLLNIWEETKIKAAETWQSVKESVVNSLDKVKSAIGGLSRRSRNGTLPK